MMLLRMLWTSCLLILMCFSTVHGRMHASEIAYWQQQARDMFYHGYRNYMDHAFPWDELKPLSCEGRRWDQRERGDLDDVLGGFSLTLIDSLDMLAIVGDREEFKRAVQLVLRHVSFDRDVTVSVFESTIRVIGGLVSAHMLASSEYLGILTPEEYDHGLLDLAIDLGKRLLPAFNTPTGIPVHRVNLQRGIMKNAPTITCPAAAGSLLVEMSYLSRLSKLPVFETKAKQAVAALWKRRSSLNLLGASIDVASGEWIHSHVGIGAGLDSFFEYLLKYHLISGDTKFLTMFNASYHAVEAHMNHDDVHVEVDMHYGRQYVRSQRVSALQAFWPGLQVLAGDVSSAIRSHGKLFGLWNKFGAMPELFDLRGSGSVIHWAKTSPLRPELIESTYHLYQATRDHKYLKIGRKLLQDIRKVSKVECGYAAIGDIHTLAVEDRMDSYFLSETVKYLYLLFSSDPDTIVPSFPLSANGSCNNTSSSSRPLKSSQVVFSTEGHVLMLDQTLFERPQPSSNQSFQLECENGHAVVQRHNQQLDLALRHSQMFVPIGISIRLATDRHLMTLMASPASFGPVITTRLHVDAPLQLYKRSIGDGCDSITDAVVGKILMVRRGVCSFVQKALVAQQAGAVGLILINHKQQKIRPTTQYYLTDDGDQQASQVQIPVVMIAREDAIALHQQMNDTNEMSALVASLSPWLL